MRHHAARTLLLAALTLAAPGARAEAPATAPAPEATPPAAVLPGEDLAHPPPGSPEDQALWRSGFEVTSAVQIERARAGRLQAVLVTMRFSPRLEALARRGGEAAEQGAALQRRLSDAHALQYSVLAARWPVDTYRVCGYPALELGSMLTYGKADPADVARHRTMLTGCVDQAQASVRLMKEANDGLQAALQAADEALSAAGLGALAPATATAALAR